MEKRELNIGDILQINPEHEKFPGFFLIVTEPKSFGAQGYLLAFCDFDAIRYKGKAYLRVKFEDVEWCGQSYWIDERKID
jgi:hypothetical protein